MLVKFKDLPVLVEQAALVDGLEQAEHQEQVALADTAVLVEQVA
jgi:hypothetical protein